MSGKHMGFVATLRNYGKLNEGAHDSANVFAWICRVANGVIQGLGLLALMRLARALADGGTHVRGWIVVLAILGATGLVTIFVREKCSYASAFQVMRRVHTKVGDKLSTLPLGWFTSDSVGRLSRLSAAAVNEMGSLAGHMLSLMTVAFVTLVTLTAGLIVWYPAIGWLASAMLVGYVVLIAALTAINGRTAAYREPAEEELSDRVVEFAAVQPMLRACDRLHYPQLARAIDENQRRARRVLLIDVIAQLIGGMAAQTITVVLIMQIVSMALNGELSGLEAVAAAGLTLQILVYLNALNDARVGLQTLSPTLATVDDVLSTEPLSEPATSSSDERPGAVELRGVSFSYDGRTRVLDDVSFDVPARSMTAIVGASGSGKTTITRLVCRFWEVDSGQVLVGGVDVKDQTSADLMSKLSMVFQDVYLFDDTLEANIQVGNPDASREEIEQAAHLAGVDEIVKRLPEGWASRVGEGGTALSGGERQRVAVARALLKKAPICLFDEATSALDAENEANLARAFTSLRSESTVLVIAHKLNTITSADQIVVLDESGRVAQRGTHAELVESPGIYREFWENRTKAEGWRLAND